MTTLPHTQMEQLGKYELLDELGQGGMGTVYKGRDTVIGREVAIKMIHKQALQDPVVKQRFYREARSAGRLSHPNITTIFDIGEDDGTPYLVMEYLEGNDLRHKLNAATGLSLADKLAIALQICKGLGYAHERGIIHRDIKPENIRVLANGRVKIMDFGIARIQNETQALTQTNMSLGTPRYMSPEQIQGEDDIDQRTDIFSFGVLFYELLTGNNPFAGDRITTIIYKVLSTEPKPIKVLSENLPDDLQPIITKCLAKKPGDRYQAFADVVRDLQPITKRYAARDASAFFKPPAPISFERKDAPAAPVSPDDPTILAPRSPSDDTAAAALSASDDETVALPTAPTDDETIALSTSDETVALPTAPTDDETIALSTSDETVTPPSPTDTPPPRAPRQRDPAKRPASATTATSSSSNVGLMAGVGALLVIVLIVGGYFLFGSSGSDGQPAPSEAQATETEQTDSPPTGHAASGMAATPDPSDEPQEAVAEQPDTPAPGPTTPRDASTTQSPVASATQQPPANRSDETPEAGEAPTETPQETLLSEDGPATPEIVRLRASQGDSGTGEGSGEETATPSSETMQQVVPTVQQLARDLKTYLETEDTNGLRAMMYRDWDAFFETADGIKATVQTATPRVSGTRATVDVQVELTYQDADAQNQQRRSAYIWTLQYMNNDWMLTRVASR